MAAAAPTRVVVADDSGFMRQMLSSALRDEGFDVIAAACDGDEALALCTEHEPDAITLDLAMPGMDGIGFLRALKRPGAPEVPVVVVSAFSPAHGARAVDALAEGAFDLVAKPQGPDAMKPFTRELASKVRAAAESLRRRVTSGRIAPPPVRRPASTGTKRAVVIATSTGGPKALAAVMPRLPAPLGQGTVIVQHMPEGFTASLAARLDAASPLTIREARPGDPLNPGTALLAAGGSHLRFGTSRRSQLTDEDPIGGLRPRADLTIEDVASLYGPKTLLVVLTGMGRDGLEGAKAVKAAGGRILAEAESTCTVYGMPRAVAEAGLADAVLPIDELPAVIAEEAG